MSFHAVVPAPRTILTGVQKLPPRRPHRRPDGATSDRTYWAPEFVRGDEEHSEAEWAEIALESLRTAVERRMVSDVPVGVLLSGGIDSSIVVALLAEMGQKDLKTYSIGFDSEGGEEGDEFDYSDLVAETFGTDHTKFRVPKADTDEALPGAIAAMSEPMTSHDVIAFYLLSREVSKSIKVVQSGQGADEVLGGYDWYPPIARVGRRARSTPTTTRSSTARTPRSASWWRRSSCCPTTRASPWCVSTSDDGVPTRPSTRRCASTPRSCSSTTR